MSSYQHDEHKFQDAGLQLRLPVDLVPSGQYSRLTNCEPVIEGEIITRDGMTSLGSPVESSFIYLFTGSGTTFDHARTVYPSGVYIGQSVLLDVIYMSPQSISGLNIVGTYTVTILTVSADGLTFTFTPAIPSGVSSVNASVFAEVVTPTVIGTLVNTPITNLFRLSEAVATLPTLRLATSNGRIYQQSLSAGLQWEEIVGPIAPGSPIPTATMGFGGGPMAIIAFRFTLDSASWAIFADGSQMYKYRPGLSEAQIELVQLGNQPPTVAASASAGGVGNLNSSGGTGYDWRYTYVDGLALTESNPSPVNMSSGGVFTIRPSGFTNPAIPGDVPFSNPSTPFTSPGGAGATGTTSALDRTLAGVTSSTDCLWFGFPAAAGAVTAITLNVVASLTATVSDNGGQSESDCNLFYTYDGGSTFRTIKIITQNIQGTTSTGQQTYTVTIPSSAALPNIQVKAIGNANAQGTEPGDHIAPGSASVTINVSDINLTVTESGSVNTLSLTNQIGVVCVTKSPLPQHTFINLYRRGGSLPDAWRLVGQSQVSSLLQGTCGSGFLEIDDNISDTTLSTSTILLLDNNQPVSSVTVQVQPLNFIWGPVGFDVRVLGCGDPARPESVYFSKPGNADSWPPQNFVEVSEPGTPIIAGCAFNTRNFAFSREHIYELVEGLGTGAVFTPFRTPSAHGLFSPWALAVGPAMYFVAKDGIYQSTGSIESSLVENDIKPLFPTYDTPGQSVHGYEAVDYSQSAPMRLTYHNDELYFAYVGLTTGTRQLLIYDILKKRWRGMTTSCGISEVYSEPNTTSSLLYGTVAGSVYQAGGSADPTELDVLESVAIATSVQASTFATQTYYVRIVRLGTIVRGATAGPVAISYEFSIAMTNALALQVVLPQPAVGTTAWQVWTGNAAGSENLYTQLNEPLASRTQILTAPPATSGTFPTTNSSNAITCLLRTGAHDQGAPLNRKQYGNVIFDLDPGGATVASPVTIIPYVNGEAQAETALSVVGSGRQQVPLDLSDFFAFNTEYEVSWTSSSLGAGLVVNPTLFQYDTLWFPEPVGVTHWEAQPTSFAFPGFMHVRDCYVAIRSTTAVTLTVVIDAALTLTYTIPSTNGQRLKQYVQLDSNKGLVYQFALDASAEFRVYEDDLEIRVKPWLGILGYQVMRTLGGEGEGESAQ